MKFRTRKGLPFTRKDAASAFSILLESGPIRKLMNMEGATLVPAKGGTQFKDKYDQSYLIHALNVAVVAGLFLEKNLINNRIKEEKEDWFRLLFSAGVLHDFNKLFGERDLENSLTSHSAKYHELLEGFLPDGLFGDCKELILGTERGTASSVSPAIFSIPTKLASLMELYLEGADKLAAANPNDVNDYLQKVKAVPDPHNELKNSIHIIKLAKTPYTHISALYRKELCDFVRESKGAIMHETNAYISWLGESINENDLENMDRIVWEKVQLDEREAFLNSKPGSNNIKFEWAKDLEATPDRIGRWISHHKTSGYNLIIWDKKWALENYETLREYLPFITLVKDGVGFKVTMELPEEDLDESVEEAELRLTGKYFIASYIEAYRETNTNIPENSVFGKENGKGKVPYLINATQKTIENAPINMDRYNELLETLSASIQGEITVAENPLKEFARYYTSKGFWDISPGSKIDSCILCGKKSHTKVRAHHLYGLKPTQGGGIKLGTRSGKGLGNICSLCITENKLRKKKQDTVKIENGLGIHIHLGDLVPDINTRSFLSFIQREEIDKEEGTINIVRKGVSTKIDGHFSAIISAPKGGTSSYADACLYSMSKRYLPLILGTGFKIHISQFTIHPRHQKEQFKWDNPPHWIKKTGLAELRIDQIAWALKFCEALLAGGRATGGKNGTGSFIGHILRSPLALYIPAIQDKSKNELHSRHVLILEEKLMSKEQLNKVEKMAQIAMIIAPVKKWSRNEFTWVPRKTLEYLLKFNKQDDRGLLVKGLLSKDAIRKNEGFDRDDKVEDFVEIMMDYLDRFSMGKIPTGLDRRALIEAIAFKHRSYLRERIAEIKKKKELEKSEKNDAEMVK